MDRDPELRRQPGRRDFPDYRRVDCGTDTLVLPGVRRGCGDPGPGSGVLPCSRAADRTDRVEAPTEIRMTNDERNPNPRNRKGRIGRCWDSLEIGMLAFL